METFLMGWAVGVIQPYLQQLFQKSKKKKIMIHGGLREEVFWSHSENMQTADTV